MLEESEDILKASQMLSVVNIKYLPPGENDNIHGTAIKLGVGIGQFFLMESINLMWINVNSLTPKNTPSSERLKIYLWK